MGQEHRVLGCFAQAVQDGRLSSKKITAPLADITVRSAVDSVGQTFKAHDLPDPRLYGQKNTSFLLLQQYKGYVNEDLGERQHQAITW
jgi:hypothetical protein